MAGWERTRLSRDRKKAGEHLTSAWASSALDILLLLSSEPLVPAGDRTLFLSGCSLSLCKLGRNFLGSFNSFPPAPYWVAFPFPRRPALADRTHTCSGLWLQSSRSWPCLAGTGACQNILNITSSPEVVSEVQRGEALNPWLQRGAPTPYLPLTL